MTESIPTSTGSKLFRSLTSSRKKDKALNTVASDDAPIKPQRAGTLRMRARAHLGETAEERRKVGGGTGAMGKGGGDGRKTPDGLIIDPTTGLGSDGKLYIKNLDDPSQPPASTYQPPASLSPESRARAQFDAPSPSSFPSQPQPQTVRLRDGTVIDVSSSSSAPPPGQQPSLSRPSTTGRSRSSSRAHQRPSAAQLFQSESAPPLPSIPLAPSNGGASASNPPRERKSSWTAQPGFDQAGFSSSSATTTTLSSRPTRSESNPSFPNSLSSSSSAHAPPSSYNSAPPPAPILRSRSSSNALTSSSNEYALESSSKNGGDQGAGGAAPAEGGWNKVKRSMTLTRKGTRKGAPTRDPNRPPSPERRAVAPKVYTPAQLALEMEKSQAKPTLGKEEERLTESAFY